MRKLGILIMALASANVFGASRFAADPALEVKTLPNSMKIAVMKNSEPPNRVSMRLLIRRGSAHETESERGLAHFLEHMAFNGTKSFPADRKSTRLNSSHSRKSRMPSSA